MQHRRAVAAASQQLSAIDQQIKSCRTPAPSCMGDVTAQTFPVQEHRASEEFMEIGTGNLVTDTLLTGNQSKPIPRPAHLPPAHVTAGFFRIVAK